MSDNNPVSGIKLDPESLAIIVQKAVIDMITPEAKTKLVEDAIKALLTIPKDDRPSYQRNAPLSSPLQNAFDMAVHTATHKIVRESIENDPEVQEAIRNVVHPVIADLCSGNYDGLPDKIGAAVADWLRDNTKRY